MKAKLLTFLGVSLILWGLFSLVAWLIQGEDGVRFTGIACLLCLVPMIGTLIWCHRVQGGTPEAQLAAVMGGTGIRMFVVVIAGVLLYAKVPSLHEPAFLIWVVVFYLATLALEVFITVRNFGGAVSLDSAAKNSPST